jgi:hypothetical protein
VNQVEVIDDQARDVVLLKVVLQHPETTEFIDEIRSELTGTR